MKRPVRSLRTHEPCPVILGKRFLSCLQVPVERPHCGTSEELLDDAADRLQFVTDLQTGLFDGAHIDGEVNFAIRRFESDGATLVGESIALTHRENVRAAHGRNGAPTNEDHLTRLRFTGSDVFNRDRVATGWLSVDNALDRFACLAASDHADDDVSLARPSRKLGKVVDKRRLDRALCRSVATVSVGGRVAASRQKDHERTDYGETSSDRRVLIHKTFPLSAWSRATNEVASVLANLHAQTHRSANSLC